MLYRAYYPLEGKIFYIMYHTRMFIHGILFPMGLNAVNDVLFQEEGNVAHGIVFLVKMNAIPQKRVLHILCSF
jgi:hypothetical protein